MKIQNQLVGSDDRNNWNELQGNLCSVVTSVVRKLGREIRPLSDRIMTVLLQLCATAGKQATVFEDALLAIGAVTSALEQDFHPYIGAFLPYLSTALQAQEEYQLCSIAVGLIGDICRALGEQSAQYCDEFMNALLKNLQSELLHRSVKPPILSCFGDVALAIGQAYRPYLETTMAVLEQAGQMRPDPTSFDLVEYVTLLREGIIEAYVGAVSAFRNEPSGSPSSSVLDHSVSQAHPLFFPPARRPSPLRPLDPRLPPARPRGRGPLRCRHARRTRSLG